MKAATLTLAVLAICAASPALAQNVVRAPQLVKAEFYEDLEDGYRFNIAATVRRDVDTVTAKSGSLRTNGHRSESIGGGGRSSLWFFREREFVKRVRADLYADGFATVVVRAVENGTIGGLHARATTKKVCELHLEPDPQYGDYASGDCDKV